MQTGARKRIGALIGLALAPAIGLGASLAGESAPVRAADPAYPQRPIRFIDTFAPGGGTDYLARVIGQRLSAQLGQPVIVDNRPGAAGNLGAEIAARATPDGHTLLMGLVSVLAPSRTLYPKLAYDLMTDFAFVTLVASGTFILSIHPSVPARSVPELIALAKTRPGQLSYSSAGVATPLHLAGEMLKHRTGANILHVPYKGGAPAAAAVTAGEVQLGFASPAAALASIKAGRTIALAVTSARRAKAFPEVPTIAESGFPGFDVTPSYGVLAPERTPERLVRLLNAEIGRILLLAEVQAAFASQGLEAAGSTPEGFKQLVRSEVDQWAKVIKDANIKPQ
ncbi:MAG: tripartite tricarboxylate transporter substrate binding protein [Burkholderiales bacterium]|nr:tripartite tricarboxylate transporter substrate binding protein [Burkholderiales bacterium]